jgi:hypothetical protein
MFLVGIWIELLVDFSHRAEGWSMGFIDNRSGLKLLLYHVFPDSQ